jgi:hypothetical protein
VRWPLFLAALSLSPIVASSAASGAAIGLSLFSSDETPAALLDAAVEFEVGDFDGANAGDELRITLTNPSQGVGGDGLFNINELYWNGSAAVTGLTLLGATHSVNGDVTGLWGPVESDLRAAGFGIFDFALTDGVGLPALGIVGPGESAVFVLDIASTGPVTADDFAVPNAAGYSVVAKFVNGPQDDSGFGAVPEPSSGVLLALGLVGLCACRRHVIRRVNSLVSAKAATPG